MIPGEIVAAIGDVELLPARPRVELIVENAGDRPIQVGSHFHFAAANPALLFDRTAAWGRRLDVPAGTAVRFEPGVTRQVSLIQIAGRRLIAGLNDALAGELDNDNAAERLQRWTGGPA